MNNNNNARILCIDYGAVRIGVALSDPTKTFAQAKEHIKNNRKIDDLAAKIAKLAQDTGATTIVIGLPKKFNGSDGGASKDIRALKSLISEKFPLNTVLWDERLSSVSAKKTLLEANISRKKRKEKIDSLAATIILQNYLDFLNRDSP